MTTKLEAAAADWADQFEAEAAEHEQAGRHTETKVLREVAARLRGPDEDDESDAEAG